MEESKDLMYCIEKIISLEEFWNVNYYIISMKKAPHGGVIRVYQPNTFLWHYPFEPWTFVTHNPESIPFFMNELIEKAIKIYYSCNQIDLEELLQYTCSADNWYIGFRLLHTKPEYEEINRHGTLLWAILEQKKLITDFFDIEVKFAVYSLLLVLLQDKAIKISNITEILKHEKLKSPVNKYGLTRLENVTFLRQGFRAGDVYYLYNLFIDTTISSPMDTMPYIFRIISDEIDDINLYLRCDEILATPFSEKFSTATVDSQRYYGINIDFADIDKILNKEIIVHIHPELLHKILIIIKPDIENAERFYHIEVKELWNTDKITDEYILANFIHAKYFSARKAFTHIDFTVNQYNIETYRQKYIGAVNNTGVPIDKYCDIHYKVWCVEAENISITTWSKMICATLDEPFRDIFLEAFSQ